MDPGVICPVTLPFKVRLWGRRNARSMKPSVSILIPACNAGAYVRAAIEPALAQTRTEMETIMVDDDGECFCGVILAELEALAKDMEGQSMPPRLRWKHAWFPPSPS